MEGSKLGDSVYRGGEEIFKELFQQYGETVYGMLLAKCNDPQLARELLKSIFREVYQKIIDAGSVDITAVWLKSVAEDHLHKAHLPAGGATAQIAGQVKPQQAVSQQRQQVPVAVAPQQPAPQQPLPRQQMPAQPQYQSAAQPAQAVQPQYQGVAQPQYQPAQPVQAAQPQYQGAAQAAQPQLQQKARPAAAPAGPGQPIPGAQHQSQSAFEPYIPTGKQAKEKQKNVGRIILISGLSVLILITLWLLAGLMMDMKILPDVDLGYDWFNKNVFSLF